MVPTIVWERKYYRRCVLIVRHDAKKVGKYFVHLNKNEAKFVVDRKKKQVAVISAALIKFPLPRALILIYRIKYWSNIQVRIPWKIVCPIILVEMNLHEISSCVPVLHRS